MRYRVLGPVAVETDAGGPLHPAGAKQRRLLAALAMHAPGPASADRLIDCLWPGDLPDDPAAALHTQVSRLRGFLRRADPAAEIEREAGGYALRDEAESVDAHRFRTLAEAARSAPSAEAALELLDEALALWRGRPFEGLESVDAFEGEGARLVEIRAAAEEHRVERLLALGRVVEARLACEPLVAGDPLREKPRALLMEALYRDGRASEALETYQAYRRLLSEELGLEPSPAIRQLELEILRHDRALAPPAAGRAGGAARGTSPPAGGEGAPDLRIDFVRLPGGRRIAFAAAGEGPPLLVPPAWLSSLPAIGAGGDPRSAFFERASRRFRLVLFDRQGTGLSAGPAADFSVDGDVDTALAVMDAAGIEKAAVLAMSQAGPPSIALASRHPDRVSRLVLMGTYASGPRVFDRADIRASMLALVRASWGMGSRMLADLIVPDATTEEARAFARLQRDSSTPDRAALILERFFEADVLDLLPGLAQPVLVIHYRGDRAVPFRGASELATLIPDARLLALDGVAHLPRREDRDGLVEEIVAFLS